VLEEVAHRLGERVAPAGDAERLAALRLRPAQVELEVERPGLVAADRRVIEIARGGARHVEHELARDLIVDRWLRGRDLGGDTLVELLRGQALAVDRRQLEVPPHRRDAPELDARPARIDQQVALAGSTLLLLVLQLAPGVGRHVLQAPRVPRVGGDLLRHVVVPEGHVVPLRRRQVVLIDQRTAVLHGAALLAHAGHLAVNQQHIVGRPALRSHRRPLRLNQRLMRHRQDRAIEPGKGEVARFIDHDVDTERLVQSEDGSGLRRPRRVVVAGNHDDGSIRKAGAQPVQLLEEKQDRRIGGADGVEDVAGEKNELRALLEHVVHGPLERLGDVRLALVPAPRRLPVVLAETEVEIGEVSELHQLTSPR